MLHFDFVHNSHNHADACNIVYKSFQIYLLRLLGSVSISTLSCVWFCDCTNKGHEILHHLFSVKRYFLYQLWYTCLGLLGSRVRYRLLNMLCNADDVSIKRTCAMDLGKSTVLRLCSVFTV